MKASIAQHRPEAMTQKDWETLWNHSTDQFQALANVLKNMKATLEKVDPGDFTLPNHYQKLIWNGAQVSVIDKILELLPDSVEK